MALSESRAFGEVPVVTFTGAKTIDMSATGGYITLFCYANTAATTVVFPFPVTGSDVLDGFTFPAGSIIYGLKKIVISSGTGICYLSKDPTVSNPS